MRMHEGAMCFRIVLLSYMLISICVATDWDYCFKTGNFTSTSVYAINRNLLLSSLASNVVSDGFNYTIIGQYPDQVYGLAVCRGYASPEDCGRCVNCTSQYIMSAACPSQKEAFMWTGMNALCFVRYSDRSFFGKVETNVPINASCIGKNLASNLTDQYDKIWQPLMDSAAKEASKGSPRLKFANQEATLTKNLKIYALAQCTPDLNESYCYSCLNQSMAKYNNCCYGKQGGLIESANCMLRWDLTPLSDDILVAPLPSPAPSTIVLKHGGIHIAVGTIVIIVVSMIICMVLVALACFFLGMRKRLQIRSNQQQKYFMRLRLAPFVKDVKEFSNTESLEFDIGTIRAATDNFSVAKKLGEGGYGPVYKGTLSNGQQIAVKRLSMISKQGEVEFKNEVTLVARLQHKNLVRLLGFCIEQKERILVYEFLPNSSLDHFIFDPIKRQDLDWEKRYKIIEGIARGLVYLHEDSRLRIIHRDLKASNILLDSVMNPKISDFGVARLYEIDETHISTNRVVGTFGYMAPEYIIHRRFSFKSDVFSFGVLVLEIVSGQERSSFGTDEEIECLLTNAWKKWNEGTASNLIDPALREGSRNEIIKYIHIGLLCVQESVSERPTMTSVVQMLNSNSVTLPAPAKPGFFIQSSVIPEESSSLVHTSGPIKSDGVRIVTAPL